MFCAKWGTVLSDHGVFCEKCGYALAVPPAEEVNAVRGPAKVMARTHGHVLPGADAAPATEAAFTAATSAKDGQTVSRGQTPAVALTGSGRRFQFGVGTVVFVSLSLLSLVAFLVRGAAASFAAESVVWAALAWYCYAKSPLSRAGTVLLLLIALAVAAGEGYFLVQRWQGSRYTYVQEKDHQFRVDSRSGRTEVLRGVSDWELVSFNRRSELLLLDELSALVLSNGRRATAADADGSGQICFNVVNHSDYVLESVAIGVSLDPVPADEAKFWGTPPYLVVIKPESGALLDRGKGARFCGSTPRPVPERSKWSYAVNSARGWKE